MTFKFAGHFRKNMLILSIGLGLLISLLTPVTYLLLAMKGVKMEAEANSCYLAKIASEAGYADNLNKQVLYNADNHNLDGVASLKLYDGGNGLVAVRQLTERPLFPVMSRAAISPENLNLGYIEVTQDTSEELFNAIVLLLGFGFLGTLSGMILYRFPTKIVDRSEERISQIMMKLEQLSYYDMLTNLPNRVMLDKSLVSILEDAEKKNKGVGLIFLDLDRFKMINDTLGHAYGDLLLKYVAERLRNSKRPGEIIARQGGDEFIIVMPDLPSIETIEDRALEIIEALAQPFDICEQNFTVTSSLGISLYPQDGRDIKTLIKHADLAMYMAKEQGKNQYCFYSVDTKPAAIAL